MPNFKVQNKTTSKLIQLIEAKTSITPIYYASKDLERGIGLSNIISNYYNISAQPSVLHSYLRENIQSKFDFTSISNSTYSLLKSEFVNKLIDKHKNILQFRFFQQSLEEENFLDEHGIHFLNNRFSKSKKFEDKLSLFKNIKYTEIKIPQAYQIDFSSTEEDCENLLRSYFKSQKFVIQRSRSHTGNASFLCDITDWKQAYNVLKGEKVKVSEYIEGITFTVNGCVVKDKCFFSAPQIQVTGVDYMTPGSLSTVGNDFSLAKLQIQNHVDSQRLFEFCQKTSGILIDGGFRGLFGLDIQYDGNEFFLIEINARQTANISLQTHLEFRQGFTPLELLDLCQWLNIDFEYDQDEFYFLEGSQLFLRSSENLRMIQNQVKPGFYKFRSDRVIFDKQNTKENYTDEIDIIYLDEERDRPVAFYKNGYTLLDGDNDDQLLFMPKLKTTVCNKFDEIFRIQSKNSLCESITNCDIKPKIWLKDLLLEINEIL